MNELTVEEFETEEQWDAIEVPQPGEFVACAQCGHRSYMHFWFMDGLLSYCKHHGEHNEAPLLKAGGTLVQDGREALKENRTQGED